MTTRRRKAFFCIGISIACLQSGLAGAVVPDQPRLVVQITADQLRGDLLDRYREALTSGFARIENGGYWIHRGDVDHALTVSFPGHTTLATGMFPSHHGLTANEWWIEKNGKWDEIDVSVDDRYKLLDGPARPGVSPHNMLVSTLGEWIKSANPESKSVALGTGNRIPVAYGGRHADAVYWYDPVLGEFTTSNYYASTMAPWVAAFNKIRLPTFEKPQWVLTVPAAEVHLANPDNTPYENFGRNNTFPHAYAIESRAGLRNGEQPQSYSRWFEAVPMKDEALIALATEAVDAEKLGQRGVMDYLAIDIDSTDGIGHRFGPLSLEQFDALHRLDVALGSFLDHLDETVGKGNYVLVLSADHGVADPPEALPGGHRIKSAEIEALLDRVETKAREHYSSRAALQRAIVDELKSAPFVADAYTDEELAQPSSDPFVRLYRNSMRPGLTADFPLWTDKDRPYHPARYNIIARFKEGMVFDKATAIHGSPYAQDRLVPIIFYGSGIRRGEQRAGARTVDVAPTLAAAAGIPAPKNLDGRVVTAVLANQSVPR